MRSDFIQAGLSVLAIVAAFGAGVVIEKAMTSEAVEKSWEGILVIQNGTLVPNPAAMTPAQLATSQIISTKPRWIATGCPNEPGVEHEPGMAVISWAVDMPFCKEVLSYEKAMQGGIQGGIQGS